MKLISLNTWGGRVGQPFLDFIRQHSDVDIFCLQEVWNGGHHMMNKSAAGVTMSNVIPELYSEVGAILSDHVGFFSSMLYDFYGLALFVKKTVPVVASGELFVYKEKGYISEQDIANHARCIQYVTLETAQGLRTVINFHGLWNGGGKGDHDDRLLQSDNIIAFVKNLSHPYVIVGDFNLLPETESLKKLEQFGLRNLIKEYGITSTRTSLYKKEHRFADYALVSEGITATNFKVLPDEVSDHSPMYLDFS